MTAAHRAVGRWTWPTLALIVIAIAWTHGSVLSAGFRSDDYFAIRPWTAEQIRSVLTSSWDPFGGQDAYHRPITAWYQSLWQPLFGYNARALHAVSLIELAIVAAGLAAFVRRELQQPAAGALAAVVLIVHPMLPDSTTAWIFNQMSLLADLVVVGSLLAWQRARAGSSRAWWLVWALTIVGFYIKEDGVMLVPALLTIQWWRARRGDGVAPSRAVWLSAVGVFATLVAIRAAVFPAAAIWPPRVDLAGEYLRNLLSGPYHVLLRLPGDTAAGIPGNIGVVISLVASVGLIWRGAASRGAATLFGSGVILMAWLGVPLLFISGPTRSHLITLAAAVVISSAMWLVIEACTRPWPRAAAIGATLVIVWSLSLASRAVNATYAPCSDNSLHEDTFVVTSDAVAPELRAWLVAKPKTCATSTYAPVPSDFAVSPARR